MVVVPGSSESFIHPDLVKRAALCVHLSSGTISMASSSLAKEVGGHCLVDLTHDGTIDKCFDINTSN